MRRLLCLAVALLLFIPSLAVSAGHSTDSDAITGGGIFGGGKISANASGAIEIPFSDLPGLAEDFTATWCDNCVYVEHALHNVSQDTGTEVLYFHRNNDIEDPFGSDSGDSWWQRRYGSGIPPTVVFNGDDLRAGSLPGEQSLDDEFTAKVVRDFDLGNGDSQFIWALENNNTTGAFVWSLQYDSTHATFAEAAGIQSWLFVLEDSSYFPDGGNGLEDYPNVVLDVIDLGTESEGLYNLILPSAYDGDDITLMLIHELIPLPPSTDNDTAQSEGSSEESGFLPSITLMAALSVVAMAAIYRPSRSEP